MTTIIDTKFIFRALIISFFAITFLMLSPGMELGAFAAAAPAAGTQTQIENVLCNAVNVLQGNVGRAISIIIIISCAFMLFLGKISWGLGISIAVAMGLLFGAGSMVKLLSGGATVACGAN